MGSRLALAAFLMLPPAAIAAELDGVQLEDRVQVDGQPLELNGIGLRTRYHFYKVYVAGLYLPRRITTAEAAIADPGAKRIVLVMRRTATADQFCDSVEAGLRANNSEQDLRLVKPQTEALYHMIRAVAQAHEGMKIVLDYAPSAGVTRVYADGRSLGSPVAGEAFFRALLRVWLGERPVQADLKDELLGRSELIAR
jgi:hypothetical protein